MIASRSNRLAIFFTKFALYCVYMEQMINTTINRAPGTPTSPRKRHGIFKWLLALGIAIVTNLFAYYALNGFYPEPRYEDFCKHEQVKPAILTQEACVERGGQWVESVRETSEVSKAGVATPEVVPVKSEVFGYCNEDFTCSNKYNDERKVYERNFFVGMIIIGTLLLVGSIFLVGVEAVSLGFSFGGILAFIVGTMRYWSNMDERLRVVVLGIALVALVWVGVKKFKE